MVCGPELLLETFERLMKTLILLKTRRKPGLKLDIILFFHLKLSKMMKSFIWWSSLLTNY